MSKSGHRGARVNPSSNLCTSEVANVAKSDIRMRKRTDLGSVKIEVSSGRQKDYLIKDQQRYKNIQSENSKMDYMMANFCSKPKRKTK